jgi:hypothetical protein
LIPNKISEILATKIGKEEIFPFNQRELKPNSYYKVMVHYLGSSGVNVRIDLKCNDKSEKKDYSVDQYTYYEYDFITNNEGKVE